MRTYEIDRKELEELPLVAEGYEVIDYDGGTKQDFKYTKEIGEPLVGRIFRVDGKIGVCKWGLHFCKNPANVFRFHAPRGYCRYFRVRAYGKAIDDEDGLKSVAKCLEFVEEYDIMEFAKIIKAGRMTESTTVDYSTAVSGSDAVNYSTAVNNSTAVSGSDAVNYSTAVNNSTAVSGSDAVNYSTAVNNSTAVSGSDAVQYSNTVHGSNAVNYSNAVHNSYGVQYSDAVSGSDAVQYSNAVHGSNAVNYSNAVHNSYGVQYSDAVDVSHAVCSCRAVVNSYGLRDCEAVSRSLFCYGIEGKTLGIFNKKTTIERYKEVFEKITSFGWFPKFNNFYDLKGDKEWYTIPFPEVCLVGNKTAWSKMPQEMREYIQSLPEYDEVIFKKITE